MKRILKKYFLLLNCIVILIQLFFIKVANAQDYYDNVVRVIVTSHDIIPQEEDDTSSNARFNQFLADFQITEIKQPLDFANTPELQRLYELNSVFSTDTLFQELINISETENIFLVIEKIPIYHEMSEPNDLQWTYYRSGQNDNMWYLDNIDAPEAWDITKGDPNVKVAVSEEYFDLSHPDLVNKVYPPYDYESGANIPTPDNTAQNPHHGTAVASLIASETVDAGQQANGEMLSIGYNTRLMLSTGSLWTSNHRNCYYLYLYASTVLGADIISVSHGGLSSSIGYYIPPSLSTYYLRSSEYIEKEILENGTTIIRGAGNGATGGCLGTEPFYPFSGVEDERTIVVSSIGKDNRHRQFDAYNNEITHSNFAAVDLCAPGFDIFHAMSTNDGANTNPYAISSGTSLATPIVAGTAALMYSVNPCLTSNWTQDLLKNTTDPIVDADDYPGIIGTGKLNAHKAVEAAQLSVSQSLDLYIKDRNNDFGYANSYPWGWYFDQSPDIWIRNQDDGYTNRESQQIKFNNPTVYIYVRVWNKSCTDFNLGEAGTLDLYWSKASTCSSWPQNWDGSDLNIGGLVGSQNIAASNNIFHQNLLTTYVFKAGECLIYEFAWNIANTYVLSNWSVCFLARINNILVDPITIYPGHLELDVYNNNNVAMRNVSVVGINPFSSLPIINGEDYPHGNFVYVGNSKDNTNKFDILFTEVQQNKNSALHEEAEIHVYTDDEGWAILSPSLISNPQVEIVEDKEFILWGDSIVLSDVEFDAGVRIPLYIGYNFLTDEVTDDSVYHFVVSQYYSDSIDYITGSQLFVINKSSRTDFDADAGSDQTILSTETTIVEAVDINEDATYNWYDATGEFIATGKSISIDPEITSTYTLEVVANSDGFKDYDEIIIEVNDNRIENITPNPSNSNTQIDYVVDEGTNAYIMILNGFGTVSNNYILDINLNSININVSNYIPGSYNVILVIDGIAVDAKTLIVN